MVLSKIHNKYNAYTSTVTQIDLWGIRNSDFMGKFLLRVSKSFFSAYHFSASLHTQQYIRLLLSHPQRGSFLPSFKICLVLKAKACQDTSSWAETRRCNKSITHLLHRLQTKIGPNSVTQHTLHHWKWDSSAQGSTLSQNRNKIIQKVIAGDLWEL